MSDSKVNVSNSNSGLGFFLLLSMWLVFGRGCEDSPSSFEHWLNARYGYQAPNANWEAREVMEVIMGNDQPPAAEIEPNSTIAIDPGEIELGKDEQDPTELDAERAILAPEEITP